MIEATKNVVLLVLFCSLQYGFSYGTSQKPIIRIVTWNVADNSGMDDAFDYDAIDKLLGIYPGAKLADIFAVGLQEMCWNCNEEDMIKVAQLFEYRLPPDYRVVGIEATRESMWCTLGCKLGSHGTTALLVIAKHGLVTNHKAFHRNDGCSAALVENDEKGVAYMQMELKTGETVCVASSHLESKKPETRRDCLEFFFSDAQKNLDWSSKCDFEFITGDFNARTAAKPPTGQRAHLEKGSDLSALMTNDEMAGSNPYGRDESWNGNMLSFINTVQGNVYKESPVHFLPTYKLAKSKDDCGWKIPCYRTDRPLSWTDRVLHTRGKSLNYDSIYLELSDHHPVFEEFELS